MKIIKIAIIALLYMCLASTLFAQYAKIVDANAFFEYPSTVNITDKANKNILLSSNSEEKFITFNVDELKNNLINPYSKTVINNFPVSATQYETVELEPYEPVVDENTEWFIGTAEGIVKAKKISILSYTGNIKGKPDSKVYLTFAEDAMYCLIDIPNGDRQFLTPMYQKTDGKYPHLLMSEKHSMSGSPDQFFACFTSEYFDLIDDIELQTKNPNTLLSNTLLEAKVAIEASYDYYQLLGSNYDIAAGYMSAVMLVASKLFQDNMNVRLLVPYVFIWTDANKDPYKGLTSVLDKLDVMPDVWEARNVDRAIACLFTTLYDNGGYYAAGVSYGVGTICHKTAYCVFGVRGSDYYPTMNYTSDCSIATHELGHGFGSPHSHSCSLKIDTCVTKEKPTPVSDACQHGEPIPRPGTLMSYCHLTNATRTVQMFFHEKERQSIRSRVEEVDCIKETTTAYLSLTNPLGDKILQAGTIEQIRWVSAKVTYVDLKYTLDNGKTWNMIGQNQIAADGHYDFWSLPNINSDSVKVMICNSQNPSLSDTSFHVFAIKFSSITVSAPYEGGRYAQKEPLSIAWVPNYVDEVNIEFSSDKGVHWTTIASNVTGKSFSWNIPEIVSDKCMVKVISSVNSKLYSQSGVFSVGVPSASIIKPENGELLCIGQDYEIAWESDFINEAWLEYSVDGGVEWRRARIAPINALIGSFVWRVPDRVSDSGMVRMSSRYDTEKVYAVSNGMFIIDTCAMQVINDEFKSNNNSLLRIIEIIPNPSKGETLVRIDYELNSPQPAEFKLIDERGNFIKSLGVFAHLTKGEHLLNINLSNLAQGHYFLLLQAGNYRTSAPIKILR